MRYVISIVIGVATFYVVGFSLDTFAGMGDNSAIIIGFIAGLLALRICLGKGMVDIVSDSLSKFQSTKDLITSNIDSQKAVLFAQAEQEVSDGDIDKDLWSQALVIAKGNENLRKVEYMKLRAKQIKKST